LTQFPEQLPALLPSGVRHFDYVPFSMVLPRAAVLVHHGGIGTAAQGIAAGVPQLVVPSAHDQPDNAVRIHRLGIGDFLLPKYYKTANVIEHMKRLTAPGVRETCQHLARKLVDVQPLEMACRLIEDLASAQVEA
jgi:rhamnosyltransferase subunit B